MCLEAMYGPKYGFSLMKSSYTRKEINNNDCYSSSIYVFKHRGEIGGAAKILPQAHSIDKQRTLFPGSFHSEPFTSCESPLKAPISMNKLIKADV